MVLRDHNDQFLGNKNLTLIATVTVFKAEYVAIHNTIFLIDVILSNRVIIESDLLLVVNALQKNIQYQLEMESILKTYRITLLERNDIILVHVRKITNRKSMARVSYLLNNYNIFLKFFSIICGIYFYMIHLSVNDNYLRFQKIK